MSNDRLQQHLRKKPYLIDAIAGNSAMLASLGNTGRLYRLWWPHIDYPQHVDEIRTGLSTIGTTDGVTWFDEAGGGWTHEAGYVPHTNAYRVRATREDYPVSVDQTDYAVPWRPIFARSYRLTNIGDERRDLKFHYYGSFRIAEHELYATTEFQVKLDALLHHRREYAFAVGASKECDGYQAGAGAWYAAAEDRLNGNGIDMQPDGAMTWTFADIAPGQTVELTLYIAAGHGRLEALAALEAAKKRTQDQWFGDMVAYWADFLAAASPCPTSEPAISALYERSLLAMKLMADEQTGTIVAAPEFDERFSRCGGYAYSWGRDAAFVTTAFNKAGLGSLSEKFYEWALTAQELDGSWQQRHYHDGLLAPHWGMQIDEGSSLLWGMWDYFVYAGEPQSFLDRVWPAIEKGAAFLVSFIDPETGLPMPSRDLWEEREAEHTYSAAAVFGGLKAAASFASRQGREDLAEHWGQVAVTISEAIETHCWNPGRCSYYRGLKLTVSKGEYEAAYHRGEAGYVYQRDKGYWMHVLSYDPIVDISLLGLSVPFGVVPIDSPRMEQTADTIERLLTSPKIGGIRRYENDNYIGGNPWILTTLWLSHYRTLQGRYEDARSLLDFAVKHVTPSGLLPEQVDRDTGETAWVVPLTWSHAMFVLAVHLLAEKGRL